MSRVVAGPNCCWIWTGCLNKGYGVIHLGGGLGTKEVHRLTYEHYRGAVRKGLELDHLCRETRGVNPNHLEAVTHAENLRRGMHPSMVSMREGRCRYGHSLSDALRRRSNGEIVRCRTCHNESRRKKKTSSA